MRGMILAAGRGERMGDLTRDVPKPLLRIGDQYLIEYALHQFKLAGIGDVVINISYLGDKIKAVLGNGTSYGLSIEYSEEQERLETGGGILQALPLLGDEPFVVVSGDVICNYPLMALPKQPDGLAHLVLVRNPDFHPRGDFGLHEGFVDLRAQPTYTFGNIGVYRKELFAGAKPGHFPLNQLLFPAIENHQITGELYEGVWHNVGSSQELESANLRMFKTIAH